MKHYLDLTTDELRALYIVIPHDHPFECLKETVEKIERFLEIAKASEALTGSQLVYRIHRPSEETWGEDAFIK